MDFDTTDFWLYAKKNIESFGKLFFGILGFWLMKHGYLNSTDFTEWLGIGSFFGAVVWILIRNWYLHKREVAAKNIVTEIKQNQPEMAAQPEIKEAMKTIAKVASILIACVFLAGCGAQKATTPGTTTPPAQTQVVTVQSIEAQSWFKAIRPAVATLARIVIGLEVSPQDRHDKDLIIYDGSHAFWSLTGSNTYDPNAITAAVGGWLPSKPWWNTFVDSVGLVITPLRNWVLSQVGATPAMVAQVTNDVLNKCALACEDATYLDLGYPAPPQE